MKFFLSQIKFFQPIHFGFFLLSAVLIMANIVWIGLDQSPPLWDMAGHSYRSVYHSDLFFQGHLKTIIIAPISHYPPFTYLVTGFFYKIFGYRGDVPQLSLVFFLIIAEFSIFATAKIFTKSNAAAFFREHLVCSFFRSRRIFRASTTWIIP